MNNRHCNRLVDTNDLPYQRIKWRGNSREPIKYYQLLTVTYGTKAGPYLTTKCQQRLAQDNAVQHTLASIVL